MKITILILKKILLPKLEKDSKFDAVQTNESFWETFVKAFLDFEKDFKPVYAIIYSLELHDAEKLITQLPNIYDTFIKELAETYILGQSSEAVHYFLKTNNESFLKEVRFLKTMQQAIKSVERKRIKADLPNSYDRLTFELSETDIATVIKKKGREDLKEKFKQWDEELKEDEVPVITLESETDGGEMKSQENTDEKGTKVISLAWIKYVTAACVIIAAGIFYFKSTDEGIIPNQNGVVTTPEKIKTKEETKKPEITSPKKEPIVLAEIETSSRTIPVFESKEGMGYTGNDKKPKVTFIFKDATQRILSLEKILTTDKDKTVDSKILEVYKKEIITLRNQTDKYLFNGNTLTLYQKSVSDYKVLRTDEQLFYLKKGQAYYYLKISKKPVLLKKVSDGTIIESLDAISYNNE